MKKKILKKWNVFRFIRHNAIFKDVYREVGLLEVLVCCLKKYAATLKEKQQSFEEEKGNKNIRNLSDN